MILMLLKRFLINRKLGALWLGQVISQAGDSVYQIGLLWLMLELTGSKSLAGTVASLLFLPTLLFGVFAGVLADRISRRRIMLVSDMLRALLVVTIPLVAAFGRLSPAYLAIITFAVAALAAFFNPARDAAVPSLVSAQDLPHANSLIQTSWQLAILLGPLLAAVVVTRADIIHLFTIDALTYLASFAAIICVGRIPANPPQGHRASALKELLDGLAFAVKHPVMRILILVTAIDNIVLMGAAVVGLPVFIREELSLGAQYFAWLQTSIASGAIVGAPFMAIYGKRLSMRKTVLWGVVLDGLTFIPVFWVQSFAQLFVAVFVHSFFIPLITVSRATIIGRHIPEQLRGRMFAVINVCLVGGTALSVALTGIAAEYVSIRNIFLVIGIGAAITALPGFMSKAFR